jgi:hypothetical protein
MFKKKIFFFCLFTAICIPASFSGDFDDLYNDLEVYWLPGRRPTYPGIIYYIEQNGALMATDNKTDFCISRNGFFVVYDDINDETYLTRNGRFYFNTRGYLVNEDGYYVLNRNQTYIYCTDINLEKDFFNEDFLIALPEINTIKSISNKYLVSASYFFVPVNEIYIINNFLEMMTIYFEKMLDAIILDIENNRNYNNKEGLIRLLYKRYYEIKEVAKLSEEESKILLDKIIFFEGAYLNYYNSAPSTKAPAVRPSLSP